MQVEYFGLITRSMKELLKYTLVLLVLLTTACDFYNPKLKVINDSDHKMFYWLKLDTNLNNLEYYIYPLAIGDTGMPSFSRSRSSNVWEHKINNQSIDSMLHIYILYEKEISQKIIDNKEYKHYAYTVKDLDSMNWIFIYNGK